MDKWKKSVKMTTGTGEWRKNTPPPHQTPSSVGCGQEEKRY